MPSYMCYYCKMEVYGKTRRPQLISLLQRSELQMSKRGSYRQLSSSLSPTTPLFPSHSSTLLSLCAGLRDRVQICLKIALSAITAVMASTNPSQSTSLATILIASTGVVLSASLAYALYFDHKRRSDPDFRKNLKKQQKKISRQNEEASKAAERSQKDRIRRVVEEANEEGFPKDPEETEGYFMQEVARGESMCTDGSDPVEAALCFYRALKVYPQPRELIGIYDKTVPKVRLNLISTARAVTLIWWPAYS